MGTKMPPPPTPPTVPKADPRKPITVTTSILELNSRVFHVIPNREEQERRQIGSVCTDNNVTQYSSFLKEKYDQERFHVYRNQETRSPSPPIRRIIEKKRNQMTSQTNTVNDYNKPMLPH